MPARNENKETKTCHRGTHLVEEDLRLAQDLLQLGQLQEVPLQRLRVLVHLPQLVLQLLEGGLQVNCGVTIVIEFLILSV